MRWLATLGVLGALQAVGPPGDWVATPAGAAVGDTVWLTRHYPLPAGWRLRPGRLESSDFVEALGDPVVTAGADEWVVGYPVVAWTTGAHRVTMPPAWRLGPGGEADSVLGGTASFDLVSVIPDSVKTPAPRPALLPIRAARRDARPVLLAIGAAALVLVAAVWWRRRPPRAIPAAELPSPPAETPDRRWLEAGEPKAVAARATERLRTALARAVPEAHRGLSTPECLAVLARRQPPAVAPEVAPLLVALDRVAFADVADGDVGALAQQARSLAARLTT